MGQNLYQDAIAEARQLREMAEQNAKNVIIDAVTPRIRQLIEQQLVEGEAEETEPVPDEVMPAEDVEGAPVSVSSGSADPSGDTSVRVGSGGDVEIEVGGVSISLDTSSEEDSLEVIVFSKELLSAISGVSVLTESLMSSEGVSLMMIWRSAEGQCEGYSNGPLTFRNY